MTEPDWNEAACTTTFGSTAAIASAAAFATDKSTSMRQEARRAVEHRGARIAGGAQPVEALDDCGRQS